MSTAGELSPPPSYLATDTKVPTPEPSTPQSTIQNVESPDSTVDHGPETVKSSPRIINDDSLPEVFTPEQKVAVVAVEGLQPVKVPTAADHSTLETLDNVVTVTPLHLLGDQSDLVDCPFCRRWAETRIEKKASAATHVTAAALFCTTLGGVVVPYKKHWKSHIHHHCGNCNRVVAFRRNGEKEMQVLGTPDHLRVKSLFPPGAGP
ncbi:hypothetical protein BJ166DRAFT_299942 [Pestalotiopsis sp. NC0098]|nr:hypothetical protein BJ166DRAFT_299942 [Pestalotiopsis sp. NC0098]